MLFERGNYIIIPTELDWDKNYNPNTHMLSDHKMPRDIQKPISFPAYYHETFPAGFDSEGCMSKCDKNELRKTILEQIQFDTMMLKNKVDLIQEQIKQLIKLG